ncbi:IclR family transcriptional regulator [Glaciibacter sp. 2TAF33]|uniref:IclR family transcriptional regulator n=1 Tax=Glaciibacter sp. 2TAF33 TaxID=3233015 RepID=UPI003F900492
MTETVLRTEATGRLQVVARTAQILRMFDTGRADLRINDVADELLIGRTSAHRYLQSMAAEGLLQQGADGSYRLGPLLAGLGATMLSSTRVVETAEPFLAQLAEASGETAVLGIWTGSNAVAVLCKEPPGKTVNMTVRIGSALPVDSAQGICFLAYLDDEATTARALRGAEHKRASVLARIAEVLDRGHSSSGAVIPGVGAIAAPVFDRTGGIAATVAIVSSLETLQASHVDAMARSMRATAAAVSRQLGYTGQETA